MADKTASGGTTMGDGAAPTGRRTGWTFLSNHGHVLMCIYEDPEIRGRDIAARVGITERAAQSIVADLIDGGYVTRERIGRRNRYDVVRTRPLRHAVEQDHTVGDLLSLISPSAARAAHR